MSTDSINELDMLQLSDSLFPTGLFATSNGLEYLFMKKKISTAQQLKDLCVSLLKQQVGSTDCVVLNNVYSIISHSTEYEQLAELDHMCCAARTIQEIREASIRSGSQLAGCVRQFCKDDPTLNWYHDAIIQKKLFGVYPVSFGVCCCALGIKVNKARLMLLYGFVASMVGAALRLGMIQHFEGQCIIHDLKSDMVTAAKESIGKSTDQMWQFCPHIEIYQMAHEMMDSKMFVT